MSTSNYAPLSDPQREFILLQIKGRYGYSAEEVHQRIARQAYAFFEQRETYDQTLGISSPGDALSDWLRAQDSVFQFLMGD